MCVFLYNEKAEKESAQDAAHLLRDRLGQTVMTLRREMQSVERARTDERSGVEKMSAGIVRRLFDVRGEFFGTARSRAHRIRVRTVR